MHIQALSNRTNLNKLLVSFRRALWTEVSEHLIKEFHTVVDGLQSAFLFHCSLGSDLIL